MFERVVFPQLIILTTKQRKIERVCYFSKGSFVDKSSPAYAFYDILVNNISDYRVPELEHLNHHVFLTLSNPQLRYYLIETLGIGEKIVVYSHQHNVDYGYIDRQIFDPFNYNKTNLQKNENLLYKLYPNSYDNLILWVVRESDLLDSSIAQWGTPWNIEQEEPLFNAIKELKSFDFDVTSIINNQFRADLSDYDLETILNKCQIHFKDRPDISINFFLEDSENIYMKGSKLSCFQLPRHVFIIQDNVGIIFNNSTIFVKNKDLFHSIQHIVQDYSYQRLKTTIIYKVGLPTSIDSSLIVDNSIDFLFERTSTNNIVMTVDKKTNIIISRDVITIKMNSLYRGIETYFALMIMGYNYIYSPNFRKNPFLDLKPYYWSRICQNTDTKKRKPLITDDLPSTEDLIELGTHFFRNKTGDSFIDDISNVYTCDETINGKYKFLGFLKIFITLNNKCIPCCFAQDQTDNALYRRCVQKDQTHESVFDLYILQYGKYVLKDKIGLLRTEFDKLLNKQSQINIEKDTKRVISADDYSVITSRITDGKNMTILKDIDIEPYINKNNTILIRDETILFPQDFYRHTYDQMSYAVVIKELIHDIREMYKKDKKDKITIRENLEKREILFNQNKYIPEDLPIVEHDGLTLKFGSFYIDGVPFTDRLETRYFIQFAKVDIDEKFTSIKLVKKFFKPFFKQIVCSQETAFIQTYITNVLNLFKIEQTISARPFAKEILNKYFKRFNQLK